MELFDTFSEKTEMKHVNGKAFVSYLADIFEKLNMLNKQIKYTSKTH